jgi:hypothetical protein
LKGPVDWVSQISRQSEYEGLQVVSPTTGDLHSQESFLVLISVKGWVDPRAILRPQGLSQWKIPMTLSGIGNVQKSAINCTVTTFRRTLFTKSPLGDSLSHTDSVVQ